MYVYPSPIKVVTRLFRGGLIVIHRHVDLIIISALLFHPWFHLVNTLLYARGPQSSLLSFARGTNVYSTHRVSLYPNRWTHGFSFGLIAFILDPRPWTLDPPRVSS